MKYIDIQKQLTEIKIPRAWENVVRIEKKAELLVYSILLQCIENFSDVSIELTPSDPIISVLTSWTHYENVGFGSNAIFLESREDGGLTLGCVYNRYKLKEDIDMMTSNLFGTFPITAELVDETTVEITDTEFNNLVGGIQKKKGVPVNNFKNIEN